MLVYTQRGVDKHIMSSVYNELLQEEIVTTFPELNNKKQLNKLSNILKKYNISIVSSHSDDRLDLQEKIKLFLSEKKLEGLSNTTTKGYNVELQVFARNIHKKTNEITTSDIRLYLSCWSKLKTSSISGKISTLKSFFGWLKCEDIITNNPMDKIKIPKKEKRLPKALTIEEVETLRESCKTLRERAMVELLYSTGCRLSEVSNLNIDDIDWMNTSIKVVGKGDKERTVYFSFKARYHLKKYLNSRKDKEKALFVTERKEYRRLSNRGIQREINTIAKRSGIIKNIHPHILRHTFATVMLNNGCDLATLKELMGHDDLSTTQVYISVSDAHKKLTYQKCLIQ